MFIYEKSAPINSYKVICASCKNEILHEEKIIVQQSRSFHSNCWMQRDELEYNTRYKIPYHSNEKIDPTELFQIISILNQKLKDVYENSVNMYCQVNNNGRVVDCNTSFSKNIMYSKEELFDKSIFELIDEKYHNTMMLLLQPSSIMNNSNSEMWLKKNNGDQFPALLNSDVILDENGEKVGFSLSIQNIMEIYEANKKIERKNEIIKSQLEQLRKIESMKDEFLAMITHELKTPLVPILGYADILLMQHMGELNPKQQKSLKIIQTNSQKLSKLIQDLLDVQKIEMCQLRLEKQEYDISKIIEEFLISFTPKFEEHNITVTKDLQQELFCFCDKNRIIQVFNNLISNSIDLCPKEMGQINIKLSSENKYAKIAIKDNASGITKDKLSKLFVKFYQIDTSSTREHGGTGLGLVVCKGIIENHGGKIWIESDGLGMGATVSFLLPLR